MTKLLLVSDNHGDQEIINEILQKEEYDLSAHLGDSLQDEWEISQMFDIYVSGNNEIFSVFEVEKIIEGLKVIFIHGHTARIIDHNEDKYAYEFAKNKNADVLVFGHTHTPYNKNINGIRLINPGSTTLPRNGSDKSYAIVTIDNGEIHSIKFKKI